MLIFSGCANPNQAIIKKHCTPADNINWVKGKEECVRIITQNPIKNPKALVVLIHGDVSRGGASDYLAKRAYRIEPEFNQFTVVTLIRPGYFDSKGNYSTGSDNNRRDHYTTHNVDAIASAIKKLKEKYKPSKVVVAGHSGGAAIAGNITGRHPNLIDGIVLAACPCDIPRWRATRNSSWSSSLSPISYVKNIKNTKVAVIAGGDDSNTFPNLMSDYVDELRKNGVDASFSLLEGVSHNGVARSDEFFSAITDIAK
jgi:pimeloyl-ACP methyl ester carboxylesterase